MTQSLVSSTCPHSDRQGLLNVCAQHRITFILLVFSSLLSSFHTPWLLAKRQLLTHPIVLFLILTPNLGGMEGFRFLPFIPSFYRSLLFHGAPLDLAPLQSLEAGTAHRANGTCFDGLCPKPAKKGQVKASDHSSQNRVTGRNITTTSWW